MNKVTLDKISAYKPGDIFLEKSLTKDDVVYILTMPAFRHYVAINLNDGNRWSDITGCIDEAVEGLSFYKRNAEIIVK